MTEIVFLLRTQLESGVVFSSPGPSGDGLNRRMLFPTYIVLNLHDACCLSGKSIGTELLDHHFQIASALLAIEFELFGE